MITYKYKGLYIHDNFTTGNIQVQDLDFNIYKVKSFHAAKLLITKINKRVKNEH